MKNGPKMPTVNDPNSNLSRKSSIPRARDASVSQAPAFIVHCSSFVPSTGVGDGKPCLYTVIVSEIKKERKKGVASSTTLHDVGLFFLLGAERIT